ncbi:MAG: DUF3566 domain-containing protein [Candidatus Zixiibacteriota bacterium]
MRYEIKSIGVWAFLKVSFFFNLVIGFLFGLFYALILGFMMTIMSQVPQFYEEFNFPMESVSVGFLLIIMPIFCAIVGAILYTIIGVILVLIYNLIARIVGGFEVNLESVVELQPKPPGPQPLYAQTAAPTYAPPVQPGPTRQTTPPSAPQAPPQPPPRPETDRQTNEPSGEGGERQP